LALYKYLIDIDIDIDIDVKYKLRVITRRCLNDAASQYLAAQVSETASRRHLRSAASCQLVVAYRLTD